MSNLTASILVTLKNEASSGLQQIDKDLKDMGSSGESVAKKVSAVGAGIVAFSGAAVYGAMQAETSWIAFGSSIDRLGGDFANNSATIKAEVRGLADEMGRSTVEIRSTETALMNYGLSYEDAATGARAAAQIAAGTGKSMSEAESALMSALKGRGMALKEMGLNINDYKDATTGAIDTTRLFADIQTKWGSAGEQYADSFAGKMQQLKNEVASLTTDWGNALVPALKIGIDLIRGIASAFKSVSPEVRSIIAIVVTIAGVAMAAVYPVMKIVTTFREFKTVVNGLNLADKFSGLTSELSGLGATAKEAGGLLKQAFSIGFNSGGIIQGIKNVGAALLSLIPGVQLASAENGVLAVSEWGVLAPILLIVAAIAALIAVVYLVGQYFGLWNSPMEMAQVILSALGSALQWVAGILIGAFTSAWNTILNVLQPIINLISGIIGVLVKFVTGQISFSQAVITVWSMLGQFFTTIMNALLGLITGFVSSFIARARQIGQGILNGIVSFITSIPGQVAGILGQVAGALTSAISSCGQIASQIGQAIWDGITGVLGGLGDYIKGLLPDEVKSFLGWAGGEGLATSAAEAGTYIGTGYNGMLTTPSTTNNTKKTTTIVNVGEGAFSIKTDGLTDDKARRIFKQAINGITSTDNAIIK